MPTTHDGADKADLEGRAGEPSRREAGDRGTASDVATDAAPKKAGQPAPMTAARAVALQRHAGNAALAGLLRSKRDAATTETAADGADTAQVTTEEPAGAAQIDTAVGAAADPPPPATPPASPAGDDDEPRPSPLAVLREPTAVAAPPAPASSPAAASSPAPAAPAAPSSSPAPASSAAAPATAAKPTTAPAGPAAPTPAPAANAAEQATTAAPATTTAAPAGPDHGGGGGGGGGGLSAEFTMLVAEVATWKVQLDASAGQRREQVSAGANARKQAFRQAVVAAAATVGVAHDQTIARIAGKAATDRQSIQAARDAELARADATAAAELAELDRTVDAKKAALREKGATREREAKQLGTDETARVNQSTATHTEHATQVGNQKVAQYRGQDKGEEITDGIRSELRRVVSRLASTGRDVSAEVRKKTADLAGKFRSETNDGVTRLDAPRSDARNKIVEARDKTKQTLRDTAREASAKITEEAARITRDLRTQKAAAAARIMEAAPALDGVFDSAAREANAKITAQTRAIASDLDGALAQVREGGWYAPFVNQARGEMVTALDTQREEVAGLAERVVTSLGQAQSGAAAEVATQTAVVVAAVQQVGDQTAGAFGNAASDTVRKLTEANTAGASSMRGVRPEVDRELQRNVDEVDAKWGQHLARNRADIRRQVDDALSHEEQAVSRFANSIDPAAARIANASWWEGLLDFVIGIFEGIGEGIWALLKGAWDLLKEPLFWLVVILAVIVIAVLVLGFGISLGAILAFLGKALLIAGVVLGVIVAAYYLYRMITTPNLTWRERGRLFGKAILELVLAFAGTGILKRLGVFAQLGKLKRFVAVVGGLRNALRLIRRVGDLDKLIILVHRVGDIEKLIILLDKVGDADKLIALLGKVKNADELIDLLRLVPNATLLLRLLSHAKVPNAAALKGLLGTGKIASPAELLRLLDNAKVPSSAVLEGLLAHAKVPSGAVLENLLGTAKIADAATLRRLLDAPKIVDAASLQRLLANLKVTDIAALERLLANAKLPTTAALEQLLAHANIGDVAMLDRVLANPKVATLAELQALLPLVDNAPRLETLVGLADDAVQLADFLTKACGAAQASNLERLLVGIGMRSGPGSAARAQKLLDQAGLNPGKFPEYVDWVARLSARTTAPTPPPPPAVASHGFSGANTEHFLSGHTWEFLDIFKRTKKAATTLWPPGTPIADVMSALDRAIRELNPGGGHAMPVVGTPSTTSVMTPKMQIGTQAPVAPATTPFIGQSFPVSQPGFVTIVKAEMKALWAIFGP